MRIPGIYHLIRFSAEHDLGKQPFPLSAYLTVVSCVRVNRPAVMRFYCDEEPWGAWWELARPHLEVVRMKAPQRVHGVELRQGAHQADVARLGILLEHGGIYLDLDVMCLRPFVPLQNASVVMGREQGEGLCNAVLLAEPGAAFLRRWLAAYRDFDAEDWSGHSVRLPARLAEEHAEEIRVMDERRFFWPMHWPEHLEAFFRRPGSDFCRDSYCAHLWRSLSGSYLDEITARTVWERDSEFCVLARRFVDRELASFAR